jgi:hypothetical protein
MLLVDAFLLVNRQKSCEQFKNHLMDGVARMCRCLCSDKLVQVQKIVSLYYSVLLKVFRDAHTRKTEEPSPTYGKRIHDY